MTLHDGFDRTVAEWLHETAGRGAPGYLDEILATTSRTRQRPAWLSLERWLPVQTTLRLVPVPRFAWLLLILGLVIALGVAALVVGSPVERPAPFGLAGNGALVYGTATGDIMAWDQATGTSRPLIAGETRDESPDFAPDGSSFVFARETDVKGLWQLMLAAPDGSNVRALTGSIYPEGHAWSPDSKRVAVVDTSKAAPTLTVYSVDGAEPVDLPVRVELQLIGWRSNSELVFLGNGASQFGLFTISTDGSEARALLPPTGVDTDWIQPVAAPDGSKIVWTKWVVDHPQIHVLDVE